MVGLTRRRALASGLIAAFSATRANAAYPDRPIRVVSPYAVGGVGENIMRLLAVSMEPRLGQKLIVDAKPGAAGNLGTEVVARAAPDGKTILIAATNNFVINQFVMKMTFDPLATPMPIAKAAEIPLVLFSNSQMPARTLQEFIAYTKANPGKVSCIPYRGSPPAVTRSQVLGRSISHIRARYLFQSLHHEVWFAGQSRLRLLGCPLMTQRGHNVRYWG